MTDLSEFLLARIAEDEVPTWELIPYECEPGCCAPAGWVGHRCLICGTESYGGTRDAITEIAAEHAEAIHRRARVLAECEAKRRIVGYLGIILAGAPERSWRWEDAVITLRALALPYADHPAYDEAWRP